MHNFCKIFPKGLHHLGMTLALSLAPPPTYGRCYKTRIPPKTGQQEYSASVTNSELCVVGFCSDRVQEGPFFFVNLEDFFKKSVTTLPVD